MLLITSARLDDGSPEHTMVDGVIEVGEELHGSRSVRRIQLRKTRGSGALSGLHECEITNDGMVIYPRLESLYARPSQQDNPDMRRLRSGLGGFDEMIGGGLPESSVTLLMGPSGVGKTCAGLSFLAQCTPEEPGLHFGFYETPQRLRLKAQALGHDLLALEDSGALHILWQPTTAGLLDALGLKLLDAVERLGIKRVLLDSLGGMARVATNQARLIEFFSALMNELRARGVTVMATWEMRDLFGSDINAPAPELSSLVDNLLLMRFVEINSELKRVLSTLKMRDSTYDPSLLEAVIDERGLRLEKTFRNATAVLSGTAIPTADR